MNDNRREEIELARRAAKGEYDAFEQLVKRTEARLYGHLLRMVNNTDDARELLQETYLSAFKNLKAFQGTAAFSTWLYRIATNHALMHFRKKKPEVAVEDLDVPTHEELKKRTISDWDMDPLQEAHKLEVRHILEKAIAELPPTYRAVVSLRDVEGLSTSETAKVLDINEGAVKTLLHRARIYLRELLSPHFEAEDLLHIEGGGK